MNLILVRHGESLGNSQARIQGQTNSALTTQGIKQVELLANYLEKSRLPIDQIISSPLQRALHTAIILAKTLQLTIEVETLWKERGFGELEGLTMDEIRKIDPSVDFFHPFHPPANGAESLQDLFTRANIALNLMIQKPVGNYLIVSHGAFLNMFMYVILGISPTSNNLRIRFSMENSGYSIVSYDLINQVWRLLTLNQTHHLFTDTPG